MTALKICGIKDSNTLVLLQQLRVEYAGFVFAESKRQVTVQQARTLVEEARNIVDSNQTENKARSFPRLVGVFVNPSLSELDLTVNQVLLDVIQLHGQETPEFCQMVRKRYGKPVWKAIGIGAEENSLSEKLASYQNSVQAYLFDTHDQKQAGGTGKKFTWTHIPDLQRMISPLPAIIAGGISIENVETLLNKHAPDLIDLSSGVETNGVKDAHKITKLVERVKQHGTSYECTR
ncbi:phosphoribosylanthranilate isomerase [Brevibacillus laterosporus]|uniref:phosphoribosylanthranilate isomerase n=1 Tax=Brevibacillus laterosporus TaxID=1465 RepID=UPI003D23E9DB